MINLSAFDNTKDFEQIWEQEILPLIGPNADALKPIFKLAFTYGEKAGLASAARSFAAMMDKFDNPEDLKKKGSPCA